MNQIDLSSVSPKTIYPLSTAQLGETAHGRAVSLTNYYMELNGKPFYGIGGEMQYSRLWEETWKDELLKMKAGGVNIVSTYVFWNHHEEVEGVFDFSGRKNLRRFLELCAECGLFAIVRVGPFVHGECRNGGFPDWLYGKPFEVRSTDPGFIDCTRRLYARLHQEMQGLYFKDGGPIIGIQIDNEYMHSAAPWEITTGVSNEWLSFGTEGDAYMLRLTALAKEVGMDAPFYTCTAWGGASTPDSLVPMWGGYAFRPWLFYTEKGEHPVTEEYLYRDNHNDQVPSTYNFEPFYQPESKPYFCCEMGGGMFSSYNYRFDLPYESVDAMANIKMASGCNMLGYYLYHDGINPKTKEGGYLNESQVQKINYDFRAPLSAYGLPRSSYFRLKTLHLLAKTFEELLCCSKTVLPENSQRIAPEDVHTLRYAVRLSQNGEGLLFLNNYQDHVKLEPKSEETVSLRLPEETIEIPGLSLDAGENCVLPFHLAIGGVMLRYATVQPLKILNAGDDVYAFFFTPAGMTACYQFPQQTRIEVENSDCLVDAQTFVTVRGGTPCFTAVQADRRVHFVTLTREQSFQFSVFEKDGREYAALSDGVLFESEHAIHLEHRGNTASLAVFPSDGLSHLDGECEQDGIFTRYTLRTPAAEPIQPELKQIAQTRYTVDLSGLDFSKSKELILQIYCRGDIGSAFLDGDMISDHFCNGDLWEISLREHAQRLKTTPLVLYITPLKLQSTVDVSSAMAGRKEEITSSIGSVDRIAVVPVYAWTLPF